MISSLQGILLDKQPSQILIEVAGIGYEVAIPINCFDELPDVYQKIFIFCHVFIRENEFLIFGFQNKNQRFFFRELIKVSGIGPKLALKILSEISIDQFINCIKNKNIEKLMNISGIGKKMSERLIIEMQDRFKNLFNEIEINKIYTENDAEKEAIAALISLGYPEKKAYSMIKKIKSTDSDSATLIRQALKSII